ECCKRPRAQDKSKISRDITAQKTMLFASVPNRASKTKRGRCLQLRIQRKEANPNHSRISKAPIQCPPAIICFIKAAAKRIDDAGVLHDGRHLQCDHYWHRREEQGDAEPKPNHANDELTLARGLRVLDLGF